MLKYSHCSHLFTKLILYRLCIVTESEWRKHSWNYMKPQVSFSYFKWPGQRKYLSLTVWKKLFHGSNINQDSLLKKHPTLVYLMSTEMLQCEHLIEWVTLCCWIFHSFHILLKASYGSEASLKNGMVSCVSG